MPNRWLIRRLGNQYYLYHRGRYLGNIEDIAAVWARCGGRDLNPGFPAWQAGVLDQARRPPPHFYK